MRPESELEGTRDVGSGRLSARGRGINSVAEASPSLQCYVTEFTAPAAFGPGLPDSTPPLEQGEDPMATCPICGFQRTASALGRVEFCPRCRVAGTEVQLTEQETPRRRRRDLIGLLTAARAQLASGRTAPGTTTSAGETADDVD